MAKHIIVVGGGISGLTSALAMAEAGYKVQVYESKDSLGGLIRTDTNKFGKAESAANGILNSLAVEELLQKLHIPYSGTLPRARARYVYVNGKPQRWPFSFLESIFLFARLSTYMVRGWSSLAPKEGETVTSWLERTLGRAINDKFLAPALLGIYASCANELSASLVMSSFFRTKKKKKPELKGTIAPIEGMGALIKGLEQAARSVGVKIYLNSSYAWEKWDSGKTPHILATSAQQASQLLKEVAPKEAKLLSQVRMLPVVSVTLFYPKSAQFLTGFGCLFSKEEKMNSLGVLFPTQIFPERSSVYAETWILGGAIRPEVINQSPEKLLNEIAADRERLCGQRLEPLQSCIYQWPQALPYYDLYLERTLKLLQPPKGLYLNGNYLGQIGLAGIIEKSLKMPATVETGG